MKKKNSRDLRHGRLLDKKKTIGECNFNTLPTGIGLRCNQGTLKTILQLYVVGQICERNL